MSSMPVPNFTSYVEPQKPQEFENLFPCFKSESGYKFKSFIEIFRSFSLAQLETCNLVSKSWKQLANHPYISKVVVYKEFGFSPLGWNQLFGRLTVPEGEVMKAFYSLPDNMYDIIKSASPSLPHKSIKDTHILVWIPEIVNKEDFNIVSFGSLLTKIQKDLPLYKGNVCKYNLPLEVLLNLNHTVKSGWYLMNQDILPNSLDEDCVMHQVMLMSLNYSDQLNWEMPKIAEATTCIFIEYLRSGKKLFSDMRLISTRCQETVNGYSVALGFFDSEGLKIVNPKLQNSNHIGVGSCLFFEAKILK